MTTLDHEGVTLRFIDPSEELLGQTLAQQALHPVEGDSLKARALARLGIERREGEDYLAAWLRAMADENGLPIMVPAHAAITQAMWATGATRFVWFLA